jgi:hypothetical protein
MEEAKSLQEEEEAAASESEGVMVTQNLLLGEWRAGRLWEAVRERPRGLQWIRRRKKKWWIEEEKGGGRICFVIPRQQGFDERRGCGRPKEAGLGKTLISLASCLALFPLALRKTVTAHLINLDSVTADLTSGLPFQILPRG